MTLEERITLMDMLQELGQLPFRIGLRIIRRYGLVVDWLPCNMQQNRVRRIRRLRGMGGSGPWGRHRRSVKHTFRLTYGPKLAKV